MASNRMAESVTKSIKRYKTPSKTFTEVSLTILSTATLEKKYRVSVSYSTTVKVTPVVRENLKFNTNTLS